ncbi:MAG: orotate phosphoribosyltransferase [Oscillospiraceae bacterium]|nr:orotate phosphoribosyltransferase [Oscillospiraceae bacterium]
MRELSDKDIANLLLNAGTVFIRPDEPFTWASGIKSPIYCDNRLILSDIKTRGLIETALIRAIVTYVPGYDCLMGTATAGIPHAAIISHIVIAPMGYVRPGAKDHGRENQIEGQIHSGDRVVVIEDLISTGGSVLAAVEALREAGATVLGVAAIFNYNLKESAEKFEKADIKVVSLSNFDAAVDVAVNAGLISPEDKERLLRFRDNPRDESWMKA